MELQERLHALLLFAITLVLFSPFSNSTDTISSIRSLREGETLISAGQSFALGFFSPGNSNNRYVGIWYNKIPEQTVVWVANRENPVTDSSGILTIKGGNLALVQEGLNKTTLWSTNISTVSNYSTASLMDSGNLVLRDDQQRVLWEGFDYPTDTQLPGMKLGLDRRTGLSRILTSWKSLNDPARGEFSTRLKSEGLPELIVMKGPAPIWRSGPWNGHSWSEDEVRFFYSVSIFISRYYVDSKDEFSFFYNVSNTPIMVRLILDVSGQQQGQTWTNMSRTWNLFWKAPADICERYGNCGPYGRCDSDRTSTECSCLRGFEPKRPTNWIMKDSSDGCVRSRPLDCGGKTDGFLRLARVKLPDTAGARLVHGLNLKACEEECLKNCPCTAYASFNIGGGDGCVMWHGALMDLKVLPDGGENLFTRVAASELGYMPPPPPSLVESPQGAAENNETVNFSKKRIRLLAIVLPLAIFGILIMVSIGYFLQNRFKRQYKSPFCSTRWRKRMNRDVEPKACNALKCGEDIVELPLYTFGSIMAATNNFSTENMLGEGGFGKVYKGNLNQAMEIAVKRLSKSSVQGEEEFKNEIQLIAKLQHKNLVRLLGLCVHGEEKILIYEFMPNKSLDKFLFDPTRKLELDWNKRFHIIQGIAQGLLYLHHYSRLRVIHRDLKTSNILLDASMTPKISDFGLARIFLGNQTEANTNRVMGTYGYMSPEYAFEGIFSEKSDVYSFGVLMLEILSAKKNKGFYPSKCSINLAGFAWKLWIEGKGIEIVDPSMDGSFVTKEVMTCIHVALLCVQEDPADRPAMSSVVSMLGNESITLPSPKQPAFPIVRLDVHSAQNISSNFSINGVTLSTVCPR